jgi:hypothetical protein
VLEVADDSTWPQALITASFWKQTLQSVTGLVSVPEYDMAG